MQLLDNWKAVLAKSWNVRLLALGGAAELILQFFGSELPSWAILLLLVAAIGARVVGQKGLSLPDREEPAYDGAA